MYQPRSFRLHRQDQQLALMSAAPFATLVVQTEDGILIDHIPLLVEEGGFGKVQLVGHLARHNPLCAERDESQPYAVTAIFHGPDHYVSPRWYATKQAGKEAVPTWNYSTVHAQGLLRWVQDDQRLYELIDRLSHHFEGAVAGLAWQLAEASDAFVSAMMKGIVGFVIEIETLEGKAKASQNRPAIDRASLRDALAGEGINPEHIRQLVQEPQQEKNA